MQLFRMLREVSTARCDVLHTAVYFNSSSNPIAIRFGALESNYDHWSARAAIVLNDSHLGREATLQDNIEIAVPIDICYRKRSRIIGEIEAAHPGQIVEPRHVTRRRRRL